MIGVLTLVRVVVAVALLAVVPLGLRLVQVPGAAVLQRIWPAPAAAAAGAQLLPRGAVAALLAVPYLVLTTALAAGAAVRAARFLADRRPPGEWPVEVAAWTALATPVVGAVALVAERDGVRLFGFRLTILALTVAHFHVAGFAAALVAGLVARAARPGPLAVVAALCVPAGTLVVLAGFFLGDGVELAGAVVLTAGLWSAGLLTWRDVRPAVADRRTRGLLAVSSLVLAATMVLALSWALGEATGLPHPSLAWMAATHGVANALGFGLCAVLAWRRLAVDPL